MPCFSPLKAYRSESELTSTGKRAIVFREDPDNGEEVKLPCGQCIGCRLERSRQWAIRCMHEAQLHEKNSFITLTIDPEKAHDLKRPELNITLVKRDVQLFIKRLRKQYPAKKYGHIGYYYCGEYGENYGRPHYHICLFGFDFDDKTLWRTSRSGEPLYRSPTLEKLWTLGFSSIGEVTFESAAYVARYITKKISGPKADEYYSGRLPEYTNMSKKPAIGLKWIEKYHSDVFPSDQIIMKKMDGSIKKAKPARYYDKFYAEAYPEKFDKIKMNREELAHRFEISEENTPHRMNTKHEIALLRTKKLIRSLEGNAAEFSHHKLDYDEKVIHYNKGVLYE